MKVSSVLLKDVEYCGAAGYFYYLKSSGFMMTSLLIVFLLITQFSFNFGAKLMDFVMI